MSLDSELLELFPDTVTVRPRTGRSSSGVPTYTGSTPTNYSAHIEGRMKMVRDGGGNERVSAVQVWIASATVVGLEDEVTLPVRFSPRVPKLIAVENLPDEEGAHHTVLYF